MKKDKIVALITAVSISSTLVLTDKEVYAKDLENNKNKNNLVHNSENEYLDEDNIDLNAIKDDEENPIIEIPDPNLKAVLNQTLSEIYSTERESDLDIRKSELEHITKVAANRKNIKNLEGLQYCINATAIALPNNEIEDLSPISNLTKVVDLELEGNQISDLEPLKNLKNLKLLNLNNNQIIDLNPLSNLNLLEDLSLANNKVTNIKSICNLYSLEVINLDNNKIKDLDDLSKLKNMYSLSLDNTNLKDITFLSNLKNLGHLYLNENGIDDITILSKLTRLQTLDLSSNKIKDITPLKNLRELIDLNLGVNKIEDISSLSNLKKLNTLRLDHNMIGNIDAVTKLKNLMYLDASNQKVYLPEITVRKKFAKITNPIVSLFNESVKPFNISSGGVYNKEDNSIVWNNISSDRSEKFKFYKDLRRKREYQKPEAWIFSGEVFQNIKYKSNEIPVIEGVENVTIKQDTEFNPMKGVSASDFEDGNITKDIKIEGNVNTKVPGKYELTYTVTDSDNNTVSKKRIVTVLPKLTNLNHVPVIKAEDKVLTVGDKFNPLEGVSAYDDEDKDIKLTEANVIFNNVNTKVAGTYEVTYKVTDSQGATVTKTIKVTVNPKQNNEDNSNNSIDKLPNTGAVNTLPLFSLASILGGISLLFKRKNKPKK